jgi:hypothetical protein
MSRTLFPIVLLLGCSAPGSYPTSTDLTGGPSADLGPAGTARAGNGSGDLAGSPPPDLAGPPTVDLGARDLSPATDLPASDLAHAGSCQESGCGPGTYCAHCFGWSCIPLGSVC